jgi:hypothetical protein
MEEDESKLVLYDMTYILNDYQDCNDRYNFHQLFSWEPQVF